MSADGIYEDSLTDYTLLDVAVLERLVVDNDLFVATSALSELRQRSSPQAIKLAQKILEDDLGDCYLQGLAVEIVADTTITALINLLDQRRLRDPYVLRCALRQLAAEAEPTAEVQQAVGIVRTALRNAD